MELGLHYPDTVLALKLLRNANLNKDEQSNVLAALQSRPGFSEIEDLLLQTMVCLKESIVKIESQVERVSFRLEFHKSCLIYCFIPWIIHLWITSDLSDPLIAFKWYQEEESCVDFFESKDMLPIGDDEPVDDDFDR